VESSRIQCSLRATVPSPPRSKLERVFISGWGGGSYAQVIYKVTGAISWPWFMLEDTEWNNCYKVIYQTDSKFPFNAVQHRLIQHVEYVRPPCWLMLIQLNVFIQHCSTGWTRLVTLLNDADSTFPFNTVQQCWIQHVKHLWSPCWMMSNQLFFCCQVWTTMVNSFGHLVHHRESCIWDPDNRGLTT